MLHVHTCSDFRQLQYDLTNVRLKHNAYVQFIDLTYTYYSQFLLILSCDTVDAHWKLKPRALGHVDLR